jgi:hypothetical protein
MSVITLARPAESPADGLQGVPARTASSVYMTRVGLKITATLSFEDWSEAGQRLSDLHDSSAWCLGDWLAYGMRHYGGRYRHALRVTGLRYQTLRNYFWVASQFPIERRHPRLTFQHHAEVASLPPTRQDFLLAEAEQRSWTTKQLRDQARKERTGVRDDDQDDTAILPRVRVSSAQLRKWQAAADRAEMDLQQWLVRVLDQAADQRVPGDSSLR